MGFMSFVKKTKNKVMEYKEKYDEYEQKQKLRTQIKEEKKARMLEKKAKYNKQLLKWLKRQDKAKKEINALNKYKEQKRGKISENGFDRRREVPSLFGGSRQRQEREEEENPFRRPKSLGSISSLRRRF